MTELPADLREALALGIARGYYTHTCVEEIAPLIAAALARARAEGAREALTAAADDLDVMFNEWAEEDHWSPADALIGIEYAESRVRARAAAPSGVAPADQPAERSPWSTKAKRHQFIADIEGNTCALVGCWEQRDHWIHHSPAAPADTTEEPADG